MKPVLLTINRRKFLQQTALLSAASVALPAWATPAHQLPFAEESLFMIGPMQGYTPHMGVLVTMLNYNRNTIINAIKNLSVEQLDYLNDPKSNTIGALAMHLAAVEKFYQANTFEGRQEFNEEEKKRWKAPMDLGDNGRQQIKGNPASYYLDALKEVRDHTLTTLKTKDDDWLLAKDPLWSGQMKKDVNTYWKWFHVCEHESNHRGQITWLKGRMPGGKVSGE